MPITIEPYAPEMEPAVARFNERLSTRGVAFKYPQSSVPVWLPKKDDRHVYQRFYIAVEDSREVRGGYILKHQDFWINGNRRSIGNYQLPLSEGIIDKKYAPVALRLLSHAVKKQPYLYALGMGGMDKPLPQLLKSMRWSLHPVPFFFKVCHTYRFLRNIAFLRTSLVRRFFIDLAAVSGIGWLGVRVVQRSKPRLQRTTAETVDSFDRWADDIWNKSKDRLSLSAVRDRTTLNILYPADDPKFIRLRVIEKGETVGWAVLLNTAMSGHKQFGNMKVGTIVDCLCLSGREPEIMAHAAACLRREGADLIVSNQMHHSYGRALRGCGFLQGPTNFVLALSPVLAEKLGLSGDTAGDIHMNRGDGDGPIHL